MAFSLVFPRLSLLAFLLLRLRAYHSRKRTATSFNLSNRFSSIPLFFFSKKACAAWVQVCLFTFYLLEVAYFAAQCSLIHSGWVAVERQNECPDKIDRTDRLKSEVKWKRQAYFFLKFCIGALKLLLLLLLAGRLALCSIRLLYADYHLFGPLMSASSVAQKYLPATQ